MRDLIEALTIFAKYTNTSNPTYCKHDELVICGVDRSQVSDADHARLEELDFSWDDCEECYYSFRFGSA